MFAQTPEAEKGITDENRRYHNFAPFVRQIGERKAQTCAMAIFRQLSAFGIPVTV
jgi:hypothetical protein